MPRAKQRIMLKIPSLCVSAMVSDQPKTAFDALLLAYAVGAGMMSRRPSCRALQVAR